jgi:Tol biopolymer transport system component
VELRLMTLKDNSIKTLVNFVGGPESLGNQPWSPDGRRAVFVSYQSGVSTK